MVRDVLKAAGVPSTVQNWGSLLDSRIEPAIREGKLSVKALIDLLAQSEEHGQQHIFLYKADAGAMATLLDVNRAGSWARKHGLALGTTNLHDLPNAPTIASVRFEKRAGLDCLVVKVIEKRIWKKFMGETTSGNLITRTWERVEDRAVNIARLGAEGTLELRVYSQKNTSKYGDDLAQFWALLSGLLPKGAFNEFSLGKAKDKLWSKRKELRNEIRYSDSVLRNENGTVITAASSSEKKSLYDDESAGETVDTFMKGTGYCDNSNVWWIGRDNGRPSKDIHVHLAGEINEFAIPGHCSKKDYDFVLSRILSHGR